MTPLLLIREPEALYRKALEDICNPTENIIISSGWATDEPEASAILVPTTERGFLDSGLALKATLRFGWACQRHLQCEAISNDNYKLRPWIAHIIKTKDKSIPYLICVPVEPTPDVVRHSVFIGLRALYSHNIFSDAPAMHSIAITPSAMAGSLGADDVAAQTAQAVIDFLNFSQK